MSRDEDKPKGADWWQESLRLSRLGRRHGWAQLGTHLGLLGGAGLMGGCYDYVEPMTAVSQDVSVVDQTVDTLALQQAEGWNVGRDDQLVSISDPSETDVAGGDGWRAGLDDLTSALAPSNPAFLPFYSPTLFQSLIGEREASLHDGVSPMHAAAMDRAFSQGRSLLSMFADVSWPRDTAVIVDVPGPLSVAVAASMSEAFDPVFTFGNWPHPVGVVPSQLTLASTLYYRPLFLSAHDSRSLEAPPIFVLDRDRLSPYVDGPDQFDNRYTVRLPSADAFKRLGIKHILYVAPGPLDAELDDLNQAFVDLCAAGLDVKIVPLDDFVESNEAPPADDVDGVSLAPWLAASVTGYYFYYLGDPFFHLLFWHHYGWYHAPPWRSRPGGSYNGRGLPPLPRPPGAVYVPAPRPTIFAPHPHMGVSPMRPPGFARLPVQTTRANGALVSMGRSGSFGRFHGGVSS